MKAALPNITKPYITMLEDIGFLGLHNREEKISFRKTETNIQGRYCLAPYSNGIPVC